MDSTFGGVWEYGILRRYGLIENVFVVALLETLSCRFGLCDPRSFTCDLSPGSHIFGLREMFSNLKPLGDGSCHYERGSNSRGVWNHTPRSFPLCCYRSSRGVRVVPLAFITAKALSSSIVNTANTNKQNISLWKRKAKKMTNKN